MGTEGHVSDEDVRGKTHGDFTANADIAQSIKFTFRSNDGWTKLTNAQQECLELIATKIARILAGDSNYADHWNDIEGYARLAKDRASK